MLTCMDEAASDDYLQQRYGNSQRAQRRWLLPAIISLLIGGGWLIWTANHFSKPEVSTDLISFSVANPQEVSLRYFIKVRTSTRSHECILTASDYQANIVGQITDTIPAGKHDYTRKVVIPTRTEAVSASIEHCS
jgi:Domain of unknown function (DUF4307)